MIKFQRISRRIALVIATISAGGVAGSLWIDDSDKWQMWLPVCLLGITYNLMVKDDN